MEKNNQIPFRPDTYVKLQSLDTVKAEIKKEWMEVLPEIKKGVTDIPNLDVIERLWSIAERCVGCLASPLSFIMEPNGREKHPFLQKMNGSLLSRLHDHIVSETIWENGGAKLCEDKSIHFLWYLLICMLAEPYKSIKNVESVNSPFTHNHDVIRNTRMNWRTNRDRQIVRILAYIAINNNNFTPQISKFILNHTNNLPTFWEGLFAYYFIQVRTRKPSEVRLRSDLISLIDYEKNENNLRTDRYKDKHKAYSSCINIFKSTVENIREKPGIRKMALLLLCNLWVSNKKRINMSFLKRHYDLLDSEIQYVNDKPLPYIQLTSLYKEGDLETVLDKVSPPSIDITSRRNAVEHIFGAATQVKLLKDHLDDVFRTAPLRGLIIGEKGTPKTEIAEIIRLISYQYNNRELITFDCNFFYDQIKKAIEANKLTKECPVSYFAEQLGYLADTDSSDISEAHQEVIASFLNRKSSLHSSCRCKGGVVGSTLPKITINRIKSSLRKFTIECPPLRERKKDIEFIVKTELGGIDNSIIDIIKHKVIAHSTNDVDLKQILGEVKQENIRIDNYEKSVKEVFKKLSPQQATKEKKKKQGKPAAELWSAPPRLVIVFQSNPEGFFFFYKEEKKRMKLKKGSISKLILYAYLEHKASLEAEHHLPGIQVNDFWAKVKSDVYTAEKRNDLNKTKSIFNKKIKTLLKNSLSLDVPNEKTLLYFDERNMEVKLAIPVINEKYLQELTSNLDSKSGKKSTPTKGKSELLLDPSEKNKINFRKTPNY